MDGNECNEISDIPEENVAEDIPNSDDSAFSSAQSKQHHVLVAKVEDCSDEDEDGIEDGVDSNDGIIEHNQVFVATSKGLLNVSDLQPVHEQSEEFKTTHFVIHDQTLSVGDPDREPTTPLPPPTPSTPLSKERGFRYQWDSSAFEAVVPVRCKNTSGDMHKARFGSGNFNGLKKVCSATMYRQEILSTLHTHFTSHTNTPVTAF